MNFYQIKKEKGKFIIVCSSNIVAHQTLYEEVSRCSHAVDIKEMHSCRPLFYFFLSVCSSIFSVKKF